jgi:hypothetical protein
MKHTNTLAHWHIGTLAHFIIICLLFSACKESVTHPESVQAIPNIFPDYTGVTIPANIAPLNFTLNGAFEKINLHIRGGKEGSLEVQSSHYINIPEKQWKQLLTANTGSELQLTVSVKSNGQWKQYAPFPVYISPYPIDYGLAYRLIAPGYEVYSKMGIYQRNLSNFKQSAILENTIVSGSCMNCHSFNQTHPEKMSLHIRGSHGGTLIQTGDSYKILDTKTEETIGSCVYPYWHPSEKFIAYSINKTQQTFHTGKEELIEVLDLASDVAVYDLETNDLLTCDLLQTDNFETFPVFSPDGKTLYFCCASNQTLPDDYQKIRYNLCSIAFDPDAKTFGAKIDTLILADVQEKSVSFPKPSFDGKYLMYTLLNYGNFGIWHSEADLYLLDLSDGSTRELTEVNSTDADSYHNWSSNSHWFVFGSRRIDGLYTRPYIASIDETGKIGKPFPVPQKNPDNYLNSLFSYNVPEFISGPVHLDANRAEKMIYSPEREKVNYKKQR